MSRRFRHQIFEQLPGVFAGKDLTAKTRTLAGGPAVWLRRAFASLLSLLVDLSGWTLGHGMPRSWVGVAL